MRLDKFLSNRTNYSRKEIHDFIRKGMVQVNGEVQRKVSIHVNEENDRIKFNNQLILASVFKYFVLNKPSGYVSSHQEEGGHKSLFDLLPGINKEKYSISGRLDQDSTGLVLITNDGLLIHRIKSPKYHLPKIYKVKVDKTLSLEEEKSFSEGILLGEDFVTLPAKISLMGVENDGFCYQVILNEGKYHQIKRMFRFFGSQVLSLHRVAIGSIFLNEKLEVGQVLELSEVEVLKLKSEVGM